LVSSTEVSLIEVTPPPVMPDKETDNEPEEHFEVEDFSADVSDHEATTPPGEQDGQSHPSKNLASKTDGKLSVLPSFPTVGNTDSNFAPVTVQPSVVQQKPACFRGLVA
jgi:hypothetical protein